MGLLSGTASIVRFGVEGELPSDPLAFIDQRVAAYSFGDIDENLDEYSIGWVSVANMFDNEFRYASYLNGDFIALSMRIDERKVSPAILKKFVQKEEERIKREKQIPSIGRAMRADIKERVRAELTRKSIPVPSIFDVSWNLSEQSVMFFSTNKKIHAVLEDFFKDCFGLLLVQQIPFVTAQSFLDDESNERLSSISPSLFV
ncbi:MAG: DNA recombination-dependent growth factor C [Desulfobulbaceae bacterium]|nr:MAG: DNA recombination-dependent growth factor C [Desulfobulbaceae bacterium]